MSKLHFVFLQGMPSPFFTRVGRELEARGCRVTGINLCTGDRIFWRGRNRIDYRGKPAAWPEFCRSYFTRHGVTDLVLLGEQRDYHRQAVAVAKAAGIRVTVTDFGYLRPDWITLERDGMSGNSTFPRSADDIRALAARVPHADLAPRYADSALRMALGDLLYSFSNVLLGWLYPHYRRSDRRPHPLIYFPAIGIRLLLSRLRRRRMRRRVNALVAMRTRYFVFPLQLEHDFQIVAYSPFGKLSEALHQVIESFAGHAGADDRLVVKLHPWDPGLREWELVVAHLARKFGVADRVVYLDGGDLDFLIELAGGMATVNSTSGLRALQLGCPVKTLGQAIYDVPELTHQGDLDSFWQAARAPDPRLVEALIDALAATIQIRGVFFAEPGLSAAVAAAAERLYAGTVGEAAPAAASTY